MEEGGLTPAGANLAVQHPIFKDEKGKKQITISSASGMLYVTVPPKPPNGRNHGSSLTLGVHALSIPQWLVSQSINRASSSYIASHRT